MVFPNFFITFVRHSFHTSHPCTSPSRETASPYTVLPPDTTLPSWHTRCLTRHAHATHPRLSQRTRPPHTTTPAKGYATCAALPHSTHTPHTTTPAKGYATYAALPHSTTYALHTTTTAKGYATHTPHAQKCRNAFPCSPLLSKKKERASTTKILHITILHVTFTRIGVKTTQKSEAIFSFID